MGGCLCLGDEPIEKNEPNETAVKPRPQSEERVEEEAKNAELIEPAGGVKKSKGNEIEAESDLDELMYTEEKTVADISGNSIPVRGWLVRNGQSVPFDIRHLRFSDKGFVAASGVEEFKGIFGLTGVCKLERTHHGKKQVLTGQLSDGKIAGQCTTDGVIEDFTLEYQQCSLWDSEPTVLSLVIEDTVTGVGRTEYGWAAIVGEQTASSIDLTLSYPDGTNGVLQGSYDSMFIQGNLKSPTGDDEIYMLKQDPQEA
jgi:hypothetical protein